MMDWERIDKKKMGKRILLFMKNRELSVHAMAGKLDVTDNAVRNYINGINMPRAERLYQICKILDVDIKDIIVEKDEEKDEQ